MVVTLVHLDGLSVKEAAAMLGWSTVTVKVRSHRSRKRLQRIILDLLEDGRAADEVTHEAAR
jgi:RNA polymerase sigma-70 factor (ECF subfamily)